MEMVTRQEASERFCTAVLFIIDFAAGSVLASLRNCWFACGYTIIQNKSPTYFHPPIEIFCYSHFTPFSVSLRSWRDNIEMGLI